jgi:hypothetical protein
LKLWRYSLMSQNMHTKRCSQRPRRTMCIGSSTHCKANNEIQYLQTSLNLSILKHATTLLNIHLHA